MTEGELVKVGSHKTEVGSRKKSEFYSILMKNIIQALFIVLIVAITACNSRRSTPGDWPQFKNDNYRSGASVTDLDLENLDLAWTYIAAQEPVPAWYGPAKEDAFAKSGPLPSMRDYDLSYYPVIVGENLYYSSSADDAVHCIDTKSGEELWRYTTDGPIHVAPVYNEGKLYFGSDDGFVYCIDAEDAQLEWKYSPVPERDRLVLNNGRLISFWPIRTGVLVENDIVYFGASLLPWKKSYFCAIKSGSGLPEGKGCYVKEIDDMTFEGAMASTGKLLIQPQGRIAPAFFNKTTGEHKGSLPGTGGCFVLVTGENHIVHPQDSRNGSIREFVDDAEPEYMSFKGGKEMVIKGDTSFILTDNSLSAYHRKSKKLLWLRNNYHAHRLILSGNALYVGATDTVYAVSPKNGLPIWKGNVEGTVYALAAANDALFVSTNEGKITCFRPGGKANPLLEQNLNKPSGIDESPEKATTSEPQNTLKLKSGPFVEALSKDSVRISFTTTAPSKVEILWTASGGKTQPFSFPEGQDYMINLPIRKDFIYTYEIVTDDGLRGIYEYDNFFNYKRKTIIVRDGHNNDNVIRNKLSALAEELETPIGLCLVIGLEDQSLPGELAEDPELDVIAVDDSEIRINDLRIKLQKEEIYGRKISALQVDDLNNVPVASELANLVWVNTSAGLNADEIIRLIAPRGIAIIEGVPENWLDDSNLSWQVETLKSNDKGLVLKKLPFENTGDWTHQYANPDNSAYGGESLWGSSRSEDFEVQWMGRPGPRFQTDRSGRKPSPLAVDGRMFVQGNERIVAVDVYNGNILWSKDFHGLKRMNIHRDCSNWAADHESIFLAIGPDLVKVNQKTGEITGIISNDNNNSDWGFISVDKDKIIGSSIPEGSNYTDYHGGTGWYDAKGGPLAYKVVSNLLFAKDKNGDNNLWKYKPKGVIINPTITVYNDHISFVESRGVNLSNDGRGGDDLFENTWLITLDLNSGKRLWKKRIKTIPGKTMYSMAAGNGKFVIVSSNNWKYEIYAFDAGDGKLSWQKEQRWFHGDHGGHLSRPAIANNRLVVKPAIYNLGTGEMQTYNVPKSGHGCASYVLTEQAIFYRGGSVTQFNFDTREFSRWERLRPDCWISTIPAQGMILSPEAGGGCSCGNWLETSMVMAPLSRAPITIKTVGDTKPDFRKESWGDYTNRYLPNEFIDKLSVEIDVKSGVKGTVRYTLDGAEPTESSELYSAPFEIENSVELKAAIFVDNTGKTRKYVRSKSFVRLRPAPSIISLREISNGKLQISFPKTGTTGTVYYTTDGTIPDKKSSSGNSALTISEKTLIKTRTIWIEDGVEYQSEVVTQEIDVPELKENMSAEVNPGIRFEYYEGTWKKLPDFDALTTIKEGINPAFDVSQRKSDYGYGFRFTGYVKILVDGVYTFSTTSDDGSVIWLNNEKLVDNDGSHGAREMKKNIALKAGFHSISVLYYQNERGQAFSVEIEGPGIEKQAVPAELLFHDKDII